MKLSDGFTSVFTYAACMENWVKKSLIKMTLDYTFTSDFAIADWISGTEGVIDTYNRVKETWLGNYKAWTEVVIALNMLSWAHYLLKEQGYANRETFIELYSDLFHIATKDFYERYKNDSETCQYFYEMTN